nr:immunoglobulin light chain junction region [Macaca mulatta]
DYYCQLRDSSSYHPVFF